MNPLNRFRLDGRVALITGGAKGLGRIFADALASAGATVSLTARDRSAGEAAAAEIAKAFGGKAFCVSGDITKAVDVDGMVKHVVDEAGQLDILVNNAGINIRGPIEQLSEADWDSVIDTNLKGPWLCTRAVVGLMKARKWGRILNVSSMLGEVGLADRTPYCSSKGGLTLMTRTLALELAPFGINVNALCPGPFLTEINRFFTTDPAKMAVMTSKLPIGRWGEPEELGPAAIFLCSEASSYMTGATLVIDGGYTAQ